MSESYGEVIGFFAFVIAIFTSFCVYPYAGFDLWSFLLGPATGIAFWLVFFGIPLGVYNLCVICARKQDYTPV
jgi:hypothetical protein